MQFWLTISIEICFGVFVFIPLEIQDVATCWCGSPLLNILYTIHTHTYIYIYKYNYKYLHNSSGSCSVSAISTFNIWLHEVLAIGTMLLLEVLEVPVVGWNYQTCSWFQIPYDIPGKHMQTPVHSGATGTQFFFPCYGFDMFLWRFP